MIGLYYYGARWYDPAVGRFIQADSVVPIENSNSEKIKQMQLTLIVDYHENNLLAQLNKMYRENLTENIEAGNEQNKGKDLLNSKQFNKNNKDDIHKNHDNEQDKNNEIQTLVYLNGMNDIGKTKTNDYQDNKSKRNELAVPSYGMTLLTNRTGLDRFAYTSNSPTSYTDPSGHCDVVKAIGSGVVTLLGGGIFGVGLTFIGIGVAEVSVASPTIVGIFIGLHEIGVGGLTALVGYIVIEKGIEGIVNSNCI